jgi:hypothetical protein
MIEKNNNARPPGTRCDLCCEPAVVVYDHGAFCNRHAQVQEKAASAEELPLKSVAVKLASAHTKG